MATKEFEEMSSASETSESEVEEDGEENEASEDDITEPPPSKKPRLSSNELYKPPTAEEINQLKETENLFQSSLFRMQVR